MPDARLARGEARRGAGAPRPRPRVRLGAGSAARRRSPSISSTIRSSEPAVDVDDADGLALAQDGRAVADARRSRSSGGR